MYCRMFNSIPDLHPLDVDGTLSCDNQTGLQTLLNVPGGGGGGQNYPRWRTNGLYNKSLTPNPWDCGMHHLVSECQQDITERFNRL